MIKLKEKDGQLLLIIELPEGKTQREIIADAAAEFKEIETSIFFGRNVLITGRITTSLAAFLGHKLAHICKGVLVLDPKENEYVNCIQH